MGGGGGLIPNPAYSEFTSRDSEGHKRELAGICLVFFPFTLITPHF